MPEYGSAEFDRRQYPRLNCTLPFAYDLSEQKLPDGITSNISLGGVLVFLPHPVHKGEVLEVSMHLPNSQDDKAFRARAEVIWVQQGQFPDGWSCQAGLRFFEMSPASFNVWKDFLGDWFKK